MRALYYVYNALEKNPRCRAYRSTSDYYTDCFVESVEAFRKLPSWRRLLGELKLSARVLLYWARLLDDVEDGHPMADRTALAVAEEGVAEARRALTMLVQDREFANLFDRLIRASVSAVEQRHRGLLTSPRSGGGMSLFIGVIPAAICYLTDRAAHVKSWLAIVCHTMNGIQLADDLLDWQEDLKGGVLTPVTAHLSGDRTPPIQLVTYLIGVAEKEFTLAERIASALGAHSWEQACRRWRNALVGDMERQLITFGAR